MNALKWLLAAQLVLVGVIAVSLLITNAQPEQVTEHVLAPCATEDSDQCWWDDDVQGNGDGMSFVVIDGEVYYQGGER